MFALCSCVLLGKVCYLHAYLITRPSAALLLNHLLCAILVLLCCPCQGVLCLWRCRETQKYQRLRPHYQILNKHSTLSQGEHNYTMQTQIYALNITRPKAALSNTSQVQHTFTRMLYFKVQHMLSLWRCAMLEKVLCACEVFDSAAFGRVFNSISMFCYHCVVVLFLWRCALLT